MKSYKVTDTHVHLWNPDLLRYVWLDGNNLLNKPYQPENYQESCGTVDIRKIVFVQCECAHEMYYDEVRWVTSLASTEPKYL